MSRNSELLFHEVQAFRRWPAAAVLAVPPCAVIAITLRQLVWHRPWGNPPASDGGLVFLSVLLLLVYARLLTARLVTDVRTAQVTVRLRGMWVKRKFALSQVRSARAVEYDPVCDFGGYGIRSGQRGKAYIARGSGGVELEMDNGRKFLIGSQDPGALAAAITAGLNGLGVAH